MYLTMFGSNDNIPIIDRYRVYNSIILPYLADVVSKCHSEQCIGVFTTFDFRTEQLGRFDFVKTIEDYKATHLATMSDSQPHDELLATRGPSDVVLMVAFYGPQGTQSTSTFILDPSHVDRRIEAETEYRFNPWFSDKVLDAMFRQLTTDRIVQAIETITPGKVVVLIRNEITRTLTGGAMSLDTYLDACRMALVPQTTIDHLETSRDQPILIFNIMNYLVDYFLLVRYTKSDDGTYSFTSISTPGDTTLRSRSPIK